MYLIKHKANILDIFKGVVSTHRLGYEFLTETEWERTEVKTESLVG